MSKFCGFTHAFRTKYPNPLADLHMPNRGFTHAKPRIYTCRHVCNILNIN